MIMTMTCLRCLSINDLVLWRRRQMCVCVFSVEWYQAAGFSLLILFCICCFLNSLFRIYDVVLYSLERRALGAMFFDKTKSLFSLFSVLKIDKRNRPMLVERIFDMFCFIECCSQYWIPNNTTGTVVEQRSFVTPIVSFSKSWTFGWTNNWSVNL